MGIVCSGLLLRELNHNMTIFCHYQMALPSLDDLRGLETTNGMVVFF